MEAAHRFRPGECAQGIAEGFGDDLREQLAWSLAALIAGLPVWALIWRRAQGMAEREAVFHLYFRKHPFGGGYTVAAGLEQVVEYLQARGVDASRFDVTSMGEEMPAVPGDNEGAWAQNRRAEFEVVAGALTNPGVN